MINQIIWLDDMPPPNYPLTHMGNLMPDLGTAIKWRMYHVHSSIKWYWKKLIRNGVNDWSEYVIVYDNGVFNALKTLERFIAANKAAVDEDTPALVMMTNEQVRQVHALDEYKALLPEREI